MKLRTESPIIRVWGKTVKQGPSGSSLEGAILIFPLVVIGEPMKQATQCLDQHLDRGGYAAGVRYEP